MALVINDRVKETSTTTGTGTFDLAGAVSGFESFVTGIGNSNTTYYSIVNENGEFESWSWNCNRCSYRHFIKRYDYLFI